MSGDARPNTWLEERRKVARLSRKTVADKMGVSEQAVWNWERSGSQPEPDKHPALARLLGVPLSQLREHLPRYATGVMQITPPQDDDVQTCQSGVHPVGNEMRTELLLLIGELRGEIKALRERIAVLESEQVEDTARPRKGTRTS